VIALPIFALLIGVVLAFILKVPAIPGKEGLYLSIAALAGLDTVCGGIRSGIEDKFRNEVFITGFIGNVLIAWFLAWFGDQIYLNLYLAVALVLGARIFTNLSLIRRSLLTKWQDAQERKKLQQASVQASGSSESSS